MAGNSDFRDFYRILGVSRSASEDELRQARRGLLRNIHPDNFSDPKVKEQKTREAAQVNEAFAILSNQKLRSEYDQIYLQRMREQKEREHRRESSSEGAQRGYMPGDYNDVMMSWQESFKDFMDDWQRRVEEQFGPQFAGPMREVRHEQNPPSRKHEIRFGPVEQNPIRGEGKHIRFGPVDPEEGFSGGENKG